jgi:hypothetical protein
MCTMLAMKTAVAVLLISSLATTGMLALWAASSRRHWFVRTAAFLGMLSPLLLVPAYEPFIGLSLEGAIVAVGVWAGQALSRERLDARHAVQTGEPRRWRFSLSTLLDGAVRRRGRGGVAGADAESICVAERGADRRVRRRGDATGLVGGGPPWVAAVLGPGCNAGHHNRRRCRAGVVGLVSRVV